MRTRVLPMIAGALALAVALLLGLAQAAHATTIGWGSQATISAPGTSSSVKLAGSSDGSVVVAVWQELISGTTYIKAATASITGDTPTWSSVQDLTSAGTASVPQVVLSADGTSATAIWQRVSGGDTLIESKSASIASNTASWSSTQTLVGSGNVATVPQLAASNDAGIVTAIWQRVSGGNTLIESASASVSSGSPTWGSTTALTSAGAGSHPVVAASASGTRVGAMWGRLASGDFTFESASATISGTTQTWGAVTEMYTPGESQQFVTPGVALSDDGSTLVAAYSASSSSIPVVKLRSAAVSGTTQTWGSASNGGSPNSINRLTVNLSSDGTQALATFSFSGGGAGGIGFHPGTVAGVASTWGAWVQAFQGMFSDEVSVSVTDDGTRFVATTNLRFPPFGTHHEVQVKSGRIAGTTMSVGNAVAMSTTGYQPALTMRPDGKLAAIVWHDSGALTSAIGIVPAAPTITSVVPGDSSALVTVSPGDATPTTGYLVTGSNGNTCTITSPATSCSVGAVNGTSVTFTAVAINDVGVSPPSAPSSAVVINPIPGTPSITNVGVASGQATITAAPGTPNTATSYRIEVVGSPGTFCTATVPATSCTIAGLTDGQPYQFQAIAKNASGDSAPSASSGTVVVNPIAGTPTIASATPGDGSATVTINPGSPNTAETYTVRVVGTPSLFCTITAPATSCTVPGLAPGSYQFEVAANNDAGTSSYSAPSSAIDVTAMPVAPTITAQLAGGKAVTVQITAGAGGGPALTYVVRVVGQPSTGCTITAPETSCTIPGLNPGNYVFEAQAVNSIGSSGWASSNTITIGADISMQFVDVPQQIALGHNATYRLDLVGGALRSIRSGAPVTRGTTGINGNATVSVQGRKVCTARITNGVGSCRALAKQRGKLKLTAAFVGTDARVSATATATASANATVVVSNVAITSTARPGACSVPTVLRGATARGGSYVYVYRKIGGTWQLLGTAPVTARKWTLQSPQLRVGDLIRAKHRGSYSPVMKLSALRDSSYKNGVNRSC